MRALFFLLLLVNIVLFLMLQAVRPFASNSDHVSQQVNAERLRLVDGAAAPASSANPAAVAGSSCIEIGEFHTQSVAAFEQQLSKLMPTLNPQRHVVQAATSQMIFIPPLANEEAANRRLAQLRAMGFNDSAVIRDEPTRRWGSSLGRFTRAELAEAHLEKLRAAGVGDARIGEYPLNSTRYTIQIVVDDDAQREQLKSLAMKSAGAALRACR